MQYAIGNWEYWDVTVGMLLHHLIHEIRLTT